MALEDPERILFRVNHCVVVGVKLCPLRSFSSSIGFGIVVCRATMREVNDRVVAGVCRTMAQGGRWSDFQNNSRTFQSTKLPKHYVADQKKFVG